MLSNLISGRSEMLQINNIVVNYGNSEALHGVSLDVSEGEIVALLGGNGAGKTTTLNTISGLTRLLSGTITFEKQDITRMPVHERVKSGIIHVPEGRKLFPYMSVLDNLLVGSYLPESKRKRPETLEYCFHLFPKLRERRNQLAYSLSGGEQQMCAIARGLMQCPKVLMLDEPSLGLAPLVVMSIFDSLVEINRKGVTILLVEQNVLASLEIARRAFVIEIGQNAISGTAQDLLADEDLKKAYLGI
jgi:branched-chain amino acid transport system ATP-binding protein